MLQKGVLTRESSLRTYNFAGEASGIRRAAGSACPSFPLVVRVFTYSWDVNKNKTAQTDAPIPVGDQTFGSDDENRLTAFNRNNGDAQAWHVSVSPPDFPS